MLFFMHVPYTRVLRHSYVAIMYWWTCAPGIRVQFNCFGGDHCTVHGGSSVGLKLGVSQAASPLKTNVDVSSHQEIRIVSLLLGLVYVVFHPWGAPILVSAKSYP